MSHAFQPGPVTGSTEHSGNRGHPGNAVGLAASIILLAGHATAQAAPQAACTIRPGEIWNDASGKPINSHGGGVMFHQGAYYWYGEVEEGRTYAPARHASWDGTRVVAGGQMARDMTLFVDDDGTACQFYASEEHSTLHRRGRGTHLPFAEHRCPANPRQEGRVHSHGRLLEQWDLADSRHLRLPLPFDASGKPVLQSRSERKPGI